MSIPPVNNLTLTPAPQRTAANSSTYLSDIVKKVIGVCFSEESVFFAASCCSFALNPTGFISGIAAGIGVYSLNHLYSNGLKRTWDSKPGFICEKRGFGFIAALFPALILNAKINAINPDPIVLPKIIFFASGCSGFLYGIDLAAKVWTTRNFFHGI